MPKYGHSEQYLGEEVMDEGTEGQAIRPGAGEVADLHVL